MQYTDHVYKSGHATYGNRYNWWCADGFDCEVGSPEEREVRVIEGFIGSCECGFETSDCYTKSQVRDEMAAHFVAVGEEHDYERIG